VRQIQEVFRGHAGIEKVGLYGSRAKGTFRPGSDSDLAIEGKLLSFSDVCLIENQLDDLLLPYKIDLSLLHSIKKEELLAHIHRLNFQFYP
jgi:predicted nucleotidyltransferase